MRRMTPGFHYYLVLSTSSLRLLLLVPIDSKTRWFCPILPYLLVVIGFFKMADRLITCPMGWMDGWMDGSMDAGCFFLFLVVLLFLLLLFFFTFSLSFSLLFIKQILILILVLFYLLSFIAPPFLPPRSLMTRKPLTLS